jgi:hypothetical protein
MQLSVAGDGRIIRTIKSSRMKLMGHVACMGEIRSAEIISEKFEGNRPLGRPRH